MRAWLAVAVLATASLARAESGSDALTDRGLRHAREGRPEEALAALTEAIRLDGTNGRAVLALARLRLRIRDHREAERLLVAATRFTDVAGEAHGELASLKLAAGREDEALADWEIAHAHAPDDPRYLTELGRLYAKRSAWLPALAAHRRALSVAESPEARRTLRLSILALLAVARELDAVTERPAPTRDFTRRALARLARQ
jgi:tetratricopeptide (TPR) repeat protein